METLKMLAARFVSLFRPQGIVVGWKVEKGHRRYAKVARFGAILSVPLIIGAAFQTLEVLLPAQAAAGATVETIVGVVPDTESESGWTAASATLTSPSLVTGVATNNVTYNVRAFTGGVARTLGTLTLGAGTTLPADQEVNVPLTSTALAKGDVVTCQMVQAGTGLASPAGVECKVEIN